jgi:AraC-like DNA-binding protein
LLHEFFDHLGVRYDTTKVGNDPIGIELTIRGLPGLQVLTGRLQGARFRRTRQNNDCTEDVGLIINPRSAHLIKQCGREILLGDGEATLISLTDTLETVHSAPGELLVLRFPKAQLASRLAGIQDCFMRRITHDTPALRLLMSYVRVTRESDLDAESSLQNLLVSHLHDLASIAIGATRDAAELAQGRGLRAARLHAIKRDIAKNLNQPELTVASLSMRHGCTPRCIQRLFEFEGTSFTDYVLEQRLASVLRMLSDPCRATDKISTVALDAGFGDLSYFNRAFRRRYGETPSGVRSRSAKRRD